MSETTTSGQDSGGGGFDLTQFYQVFFEEAGENLSNMENLLLNLDVDQPDDEQLNAIFRCAHSIKGGAATFGFQDVADLTHVMETLLDRLRRHESQVTAAMVDVLLESGDTLRGLLGRYQGTHDDVIDASDLVARIRAHVDGTAAGAVAVARAPAGPTILAPAPVPQQVVQTAVGAVAMDQQVLEITIGPLDRPDVADNIADLFSEIPGLGTIEKLDDGTPDAERKRRFRVVTATSENELLDLFTFHVSREQVSIVRIPPPAAPAAAAPEPVAAPVAAPATAPARKPDLVPDDTFGFFVDLDAPKTAAAPAPAASPAAAPAPAAPAAPRSARADKPAANAADASTIRVSVEKVDQLINLVGELVITQAMLAQTGRNLDPIVHQQLMSNLVDLERNTRLLQEAVMAIRMIPMAVVFNRFPRMLRDLATKLGKQVELHTIGEATELDKGMIEKITDPLTHLVRNSLDHGIEAPEDRIAAGKPAAGSITLSAEHKGGAISIEVRDDGRGLNAGKLASKARERGIPVRDDITDQEAWQLIFEPGFSTAETVTDVSGRGVGMDVVRKNIQGLGGTVELDSAEGYGTRVSISLPLTLAIMDGMSVGVADEVYILPLASVVESIQLEAQQIRSVAGSNHMIEVRGEYLPVVPLDETFRVPRFDKGRPTGILIVVESEGTRVALLVDELLGQHQIVVKNLEANYRKVPGVSGATILGDGRVALIIDISHLVRRARH